MKMDLLSLPIDVCCSVVCCRLSFRELVRLDAAYCCQNRSAWIHLLRSKQFTFRALVDISDFSKMRWMLRRNVKVSDIEFVRELNRTDVSGISKYLRTHGSSVRSVYFSGGSQVEMHLVAIFCRALTRLCATAVFLTSEFANVLHCNPNIQHMAFNDVVCNEPNLMEGLSFHKLQIFHAVDVDSSENVECMWHESTHSDSLHTVILDNCGAMYEDFSAMQRNCPQIRSLSYNYYFLGRSSPLAHNAALMTRLVNLSASYDHSLTDDAVLTLAMNLTALRTLNIQYCIPLTEQSLLHIAEHSSTTLEVLYVDVHNPESKETGQVLETFSQKCTKLMYLNVECGNKLLCAGRGTSMLVRGCPALRTLVVNKQETSRDFIAVVRPELKLLVHDDSTEYDILSMPI